MLKTKKLKGAASTQSAECSVGAREHQVGDLLLWLLTFSFIFLKNTLSFVVPDE